MTSPTILICNDDGYFAEGLIALRDALQPLGRVIVVAPSQDNSGVSHKITLNTALRLRQVDDDFYAVTGTPVDCVHLAVHGVLEDRKPDLLISGVNHGLNLGEDTAYSGTVAAAYEGYVQGIPSMAVSTGWMKGPGGFRFENAQKAARALAESCLAGDPLLRQAVWNINVPGDEVKGMRITRLDKRSFKSSVVKRKDPRGVPYYWIGPYFAEFDSAEDTDYAAYHAGYITATPLKVEMTHFETLAACAERQTSWQSLFKSDGNHA